MIEYLIKTDIDLFLYLNSIHSAFFDTLMYLISGKATWIPLYLGVLFFSYKKFGAKKTAFMFLAFLLLLLLSDQVSVHLFKFQFKRLRPCFDLRIADIVHTVKMPGGLYGFVSSHATNSFAFALLAALFFKNKYFTMSILFWAAIVSYSRVYLGVHFPADIIAGAILGVILALIVYTGFSVIEKHIKK